MPSPEPAPPPPAGGVPAYSQVPSTDRIRVAWQRRHETDYVFSFWTALGWTILTFGIYWFYVLYQLVRRSRDHNARRLELLDAATAFAWEQAEAQGLTGELRPNFERVALQTSVLRGLTAEFREPALWVLLSLIASGLAQIVAYILLDGDLVKHDYAEGAIEAELSSIYERLAMPVAPPDPSRLKGRHSYGGRIAATLLTCGVYMLWWTYDVMVEGNRHFEHNWRWEDDLAAQVQQAL